MRASWIMGGAGRGGRPSSNDKYPHKRQNRKQTQKRRRPHKDSGGHWNKAITSKGTPEASDAGRGKPRVSVRAFGASVTLVIASLWTSDPRAMRE